MGLTYGQKLVGLSFNPSKDLDVENCKQGFASLIDQQKKIRDEAMGDQETVRLASIAITQIQQAQMWAVKAITWKYSK